MKENGIDDLTMVNDKLGIILTALVKNDEAVGIFDDTFLDKLVEYFVSEGCCKLRVIFIILSFLKKDYCS